MLTLGSAISVSLPVLMFGLVFAALGLAEGGSFPASIKTVAEWFPKEERAATGLFNAGSNAGAVACPLLVPLLVKCWGWPVGFYATGAWSHLDGRLVAVVFPARTAPADIRG